MADKNKKGPTIYPQEQWEDEKRAKGDRDEIKNLLAGSDTAEENLDTLEDTSKSMAPSATDLAQTMEENEGVNTATQQFREQLESADAALKTPSPTSVSGEFRDPTEFDDSELEGLGEGSFDENRESADKGLSILSRKEITLVSKMEFEKASEEEKMEFSEALGLAISDKLGREPGTLREVIMNATSFPITDDDNETLTAIGKITREIRNKPLTYYRPETCLSLKAFIEEKGLKVDETTEEVATGIMSDFFDKVIESNPWLKRA